MTFIMFQRGATSWGFQVGRLYLNWRYASYWLYSRNRRDYARTLRQRGLTCKCYRCRAWFYAWPAKLGWERDQ